MGSARRKPIGKPSREGECAHNGTDSSPEIGGYHSAKELFVVRVCLCATDRYTVCSDDIIVYLGGRTMADTDRQKGDGQWQGSRGRNSSARCCTLRVVRGLGVRVLEQDGVLLADVA